MTYVYPFTSIEESTKRRIWEKGTLIQGYSEDIWRHDIYGSVMKYDEHGNTRSQYGWEIDHIMPRAKGGQTTWNNLQPLQWENNRRKGDSYP
ncbi:HNH endonuclease [bacterium]|nr:HNH endonuclease [bacterium]